MDVTAGKKVERTTPSFDPLFLILPFQSHLIQMKINLNFLLIFAYVLILVSQQCLFALEILTQLAPMICHAFWQSLLLLHSLIILDPLFSPMDDLKFTYY